MEQETSPDDYWCQVCSLDLQSAASLKQHQRGRKHQTRCQRLGVSHLEAEVPTPVAYSAVLAEEEFFYNIVNGAYKNIVILTGAGVSTSAGIPDYRSSNGIFQQAQRRVQASPQSADIPPGYLSSPEKLFSRNFAVKFPDLWTKEVFSVATAQISGRSPTPTHRFCSFMARKGWLKRLYTQNVDGLHTHPSLKWPDPRLIVECHGSLPDGNLVMYEDPLPERFFKCASSDFDPRPPKKDDPVDLILVIGTSLKVAPFSCLPNLAPKYCHRVIVDPAVNEILQRCPGPGRNPYAFPTANFGTRKAVSSKPLWLDRSRVRRKRWSQLFVPEDCDGFFKRLADAVGIEID